MATIDDKIQSAKDAIAEIQDKFSALNHVVRSTDGLIEVNAAHGITVTSAQKTTAMIDYAKCKQDLSDAVAKLP